MSAFTNTSAFQGVKEFHNDHGVNFRAMNEGDTVWGIYKERNNAFIRITTFHCRDKEVMKICKATYAETHS